VRGKIKSPSRFFLTGGYRMAREIKVDMSRESVDLEDLSSRLAHKKVCNINLKRNKNLILKL